MDLLPKISDWLFWTVIVLYFFTRRKHATLREEPTPFKVPQDGNPLQLPEGWLESMDGKSVIWKVKPGLKTALGCFAVGAFTAAILVSIALGNELPAPRSYILVEQIFPPWHHPFNFGAWLKVLFNLVPFLCLALGAWCIGGEHSFRISTNRLEFTYRWFRWSWTKVFTDATFRIEAFSYDKYAPEARVWRWSIEVHTVACSKTLFLDSGRCLKMAEPETIVSELSRLTGWPAKTVFLYAVQPS